MTDIRLRTVALDPVRAEIAVDLGPWPLDPGDEVRGKLVGPQCRHASTIEIAYPLRKKPGTATYHFLIPEPSLWEPDTPFVYSGKIEWLRGDTKLAEATVVHALFSLKKTAAGWRLNGKPFEPRAIEAAGAVEELPALREQGFNVLRVAEASLALRERAARIGFLLAGDGDGLRMV
ncbi:MAG: hypothetical protein U0793_03025 [Gemmataceae bacterium]